MSKLKHVLLLLSLAVFSVQSQNYNIEWGPMENRTGRMLSILPSLSDDYYTLRWSGGALLGSFKVAHHKDLQLTGSGKIVMQADGGMANYEGIACIAGKLLVFLSDKKEGHHYLYMQEYGEDLKPSGKAVELASYELEKGKSKGFFNIISSRNKEYFGIVWEIPGKREEKDRYGFKIFDKQLTEVMEGDYKLPFEGKLSSINEHYLSNTGDYFISVTEFSPSDDKRLFRSYLNYKSMHILQITNEGIEDFEISMQGKRVEAMAMNSDNNRIFTLTGIYGETSKAGVTGLFYLRADFAGRKVINEGFERFGKDFITQDWSDRQKEKAEKREQRGKGEPQLYNYVMRQTEVLEDGSLVGSLEQYYVVVSTYMDPRTGASRTTYTYYYNDIIAFKVGASGGFEWLQKIPKYQVSTNDSGPYSSYERFVDNGKLCFIFNDNNRNYDENGSYIGDDKLYAANFSKKKNAVAIVEVDIANGSMTRKTFFDRKEIDALAVPKLFQIDYNTREMLLYAVYGKKERFGLMKFNH